MYYTRLKAAGVKTSRVTDHVNHQWIKESPKEILALLRKEVAEHPRVGRVCNVMLPPWNAKGDNITEDTAAVAAALAACSPGGTVLLPAGHVFYIRPVRLPSYSTLQIDGDIAGWRDIQTWPNSTTKRCPTTPYGLPRNKIITAPKKEALLWAANGTHIVVKGKGTVDGGGWQWWPLRKLPGDYWHNCRPILMEFGSRHGDVSGVSDIQVEGITLKDSPFWTFSGSGLLRAVISSVHVTTSGCGYDEAPNTDGFNIQGNDILIEDSSVHNGDDCVPIFPPSKNITVRNMTCECGNGMVPCIWPPFSVPGDGGDIEDVLFDGATFKNTKTVVAIKALAGFVGTASNITYRNFVLDRVNGAAIMINMFGQGLESGGLF